MLSFNPGKRSGCDIAHRSFGHPIMSGKVFVSNKFSRAALSDNSAPFAKSPSSTFAYLVATMNASWHTLLRMSYLSS